jgi:hypothetical protein
MTSLGTFFISLLGAVALAWPARPQVPPDCAATLLKSATSDLKQGDLRDAEENF